ncbi:hypothetical protein M0P65_02385 [Candidatus Gracilibacteria bacterium]|nr:hypothetical protein [Candidatus Gracilibacteria bacterium]
MTRKLSTSSTQLTVETGFLGECLLNLGLISETQLKEALIIQKEYRENSNLSRPIGEILSEICGISMEKIESVFVKEQLIFGIKRLVKDILHQDGIINKRIDNEELPSLKTNFSEENIQITIPYWGVNCAKSMYFKEEDGIVKASKSPNYTIESIEGLLELVISLNGEKIFHEKTFFYNVKDKKINISPMELMGMIRVSFLTLYFQMSKNKSIQSKTIDYGMGSID